MSEHYIERCSCGVVSRLTAERLREAAAHRDGHYTDAALLEHAARVVEAAEQAQMLLRVALIPLRGAVRDGTPTPHNATESVGVARDALDRALAGEPKP